jgi:carbamoylphosphate synthase small subunit
VLRLHGGGKTMKLKYGIAARTQPYRRRRRSGVFTSQNHATPCLRRTLCRRTRRSAFEPQRRHLRGAGLISTCRRFQCSLKPEAWRGRSSAALFDGLSPVDKATTDVACKAGETFSAIPGDRRRGKAICP